MLEGEHLVTREMEADDLRRIPIREVAPDRIAHHLAQFGDGIRLREDRGAECMSEVSTLGCFFNDEDDLGRNAFYWIVKSSVRGPSVRRPVESLSITRT